MSITDSSSFSLENCIKRAAEARSKAASATHSADAKVWAEVAEVWDHMADCIRKNGLANYTGGMPARKPTP